MKLYIVYWQYNEHEMENDIFASDTGTNEDGRTYLLNTYGGEGEYMSQPELLKEVSVHEFNTVADSAGNPYKVGLA